ncbi:hypothetical protein DFH06DRAFT_1003228, partial [Mycena polygramma]
KGRPCRIVDMSRSRSGRGWKVHIIGIDLFTPLRQDSVQRHTEKMKVPSITHNEYTLVNVFQPSHTRLASDTNLQISVTDDTLKLAAFDGSIRDVKAERWAQYADTGSGGTIVTLTRTGGEECVRVL